MKLIAGFLICLIPFFFSCSSGTTEERTGAAGEQKKQDSPDPEQLVQKWNLAHTTKDTALFSSLLADSVLFYHTLYDKASVLRKKAKLFGKYPDFKQELSGIRIDSSNARQLTCFFNKKVTIKNETKEYPSYLVLKNTGKAWLIVTEGDEITDRNLAKKSEKSSSEGKVEGDYNGDGKKEYAWLVAPEFPKSTEDNFGECTGNCECFIKFSDESIPPLKVDMCIGGVPVNEGDLNEDGADELGLLPDWWTSCWRAYFVYTFRNGEWKNAVPSISTYCAQWEDGVDVISKDPKKPGFAIIRYTELTEEADFKVKSRSVKVEK
ncbi:MAG: nuclear transport factor 2 family protein [Bacteroidia bacterium]